MERLYSQQTYIQMEIWQHFDYQYLFVYFSLGYITRYRETLFCGTKHLYIIKCSHSVYVPIGCERGHYSFQIFNITGNKKTTNRTWRVFNNANFS